MSGAQGDLPLDRDEIAADWCVRLGEGALTSTEQREFDVWLEAPGNRAAFEEAVTVWQGAEAAADMPELIHLRSEALDSFRRANGRRWSPMRRGWIWPAGAVAAVLLVALAAAFLLLRTPVQAYETGIGEREVAMLEDGSRVSLDGASQVEARFSSERREFRLLRGRAKFDVARDPLRPFSVIVGNRMIVATGTSFSVELVGDEIRVVLYEGHVEVLDNSAGGRPQPVRLAGANAPPAAEALTPGRELVTSTAQPVAAVSPTDVGRSLAWEGGQLSFDNEPLGLAVARMNRYARTPLEIGDAAAARVRVSGVFTAGDTEAFIEGVSVVHGLRADRGPERIALRGS